MADLSCGSDEIARWTGSAWNCSSDDDTPFARTYVVGPVGTDVENGTALLNAVAAITPPTSQSEAVLVVIEPGAYDLGVGFLSFTSWMTIEGAGVNATSITSAYCGDFVTDGTLFASPVTSGIGLRHLSVENTCSFSPGNVGSALYSAADGAVIEQARLSAIGSAALNITARITGLGVKVTSVDLKAEGGFDNFGLYTSTGSGVFSFVTVEAIGGISDAIAFYNHAGPNLLVENSTLRASGGQTRSIAFYNDNAADFTLRHVIAEAELGPESTIGVKSTRHSSGVLDDVKATGTIAIELGNETLSKSYDLRNVHAEGFVEGIVCNADTAVLTLDIDDSWILGASGIGVTNISGSSECDVTIKGSYVMGTPGGVSGNATCIATWDDTSLYFSTCPGAGP